MAKLLADAKPFEGCRIYGPYEGGSRGTRRIVAIVRADKSRTTMSYARYLMCVREGRLLDAEEEADHRDDNRLNDDPSNLQVLTKSKNREKYSPGKTMVTLLCSGCGEEFTRERRQTHLVKGGTPTSCSRSCARRVQSRSEAE
jgi:hypothetical protein